MSEVQATPQVSAQEEGFKVFVGNLSFSTKEESLTEMFSKVGAITGATIINRGARSLGYGFVTFVNETDAKAAIASCDKADISGRTINVEMAKPPTVQTPRAPRVAAEPREPRAPVLDAEGNELPAKKRKPRNKPNRGGAKGGRRPRTDGETEEAGDAPTESLSAKLAATSLDATKEGETAAPRGGRPPRAPRAVRAPLVRRGTPTGLASTTLLFAANLPFSVDDAALLALFEGYKVVTARVVVKKYGPGEGRSKGFGFVDFESEEEQKRALENVNGKEIDGREITLKIAIDHAEETVAAPIAAAATDAAAPVVA